MTLTTLARTRVRARTRVSIFTSNPLSSKYTSTSTPSLSLRRLPRCSPFSLHSSTSTFSTSSKHYLQAESVRSTTADESNKNQTIAVLGGGISGLASALYLKRALSKIKTSTSSPWKIILVEKKQRLGGWVKSERVVLPLKGEENGMRKPETALLESGPRSLRPAGYSGLVMLELIKSLDLLPRLLKVTKSSPSAKNRYIYYPNSLARLPSSLISAILSLRLPVLKGLIPSLLSEPFILSRFSRPKSESTLEIQRQRKRESLQDESVHDFLTRRFGNRKSIPENLVSAILHGIYAGDSRNLSVRSVLPFLWNTERKYGSLLRSILPVKFNKRYRESTQEEKLIEERNQKELKEIENRLGDDFVKEMKDISVYSFPEGIEEITRAMRHELEKDEGVEIWSGTECSGIRNTGSKGDIEVETSNGSLHCSRIISALPSSVLASILDPSSLPPQALSLLSHNPASNVGVINVAINSSEIPSGERLLGKIEGFGYLIPRSTLDNKDGILGVVFDTDALPDQDKGNDGENSKIPTKFTVMIGGSTYWKSSKDSQDTSIPNKIELKNSAINALSKQLGIDESLLKSENSFIKVHVQRNAIPQYLVGHPIRMKTLHDLLSKLDSNSNDKSWSNSLTLVGASYTGVSLNDCVAHSERTIKKLLENGLDGKVTGLEEFDNLS